MNLLVCTWKHSMHICLIYQYSMNHNTSWDAIGMQTKYTVELLNNLGQFLVLNLNSASSPFYKWFLISPYRMPQVTMLLERFMEAVRKCSCYPVTLCPRGMRKARDYSQLWSLFFVSPYPLYCDDLCENDGSLLVLLEGIIMKIHLDFELSFFQPDWWLWATVHRPCS